MSSKEKQNILELRRGGRSNREIAETLGMSVNTVKSVCRRNGLMNDASNETGNKENNDSCKQCGKKLIQNPKMKPKTFCGDSCRFIWWNAHRGELNRKAVQRRVCVSCGGSFESYGNDSRKYCCHACYIAHRFGKEVTRHDAGAV